MSEVCTKCGLPKELCVCENIAKERQRIKVEVVKRKFGKLHTVISGIDSRDIDLKDLTKKLKNELACGGTYKDGRIELLGNHKEKVIEYLSKLGFSV